MNPFIVKILAVGLTLSQLFTRTPDQFQPQLTDPEKTSVLLQDGCTFINKQFGLESINFDFLLTVMAKKAKELKAKKDEPVAGADPDADLKDDAATVAPSPKSLTDKLLAQFDMDQLLAAYKQFCKGEKVENSPIKINEVMDFYNNAMKDLPDVSKLKNFHLPEASTILDGNGARFTEIYGDNGRRHYVSVNELPPYIKLAFVAAEDKRFFEHDGVDVSGIVRAFSDSFTKPGRAQGASTISQQVAKNLLVGDDLTFDRKMREMVSAMRLEAMFSADSALAGMTPEARKAVVKDEVLDLYLNYIFLGRASWGIEMAAMSYFGKSAKLLSLPEAALLAGLTKGPNAFNPDRFPEKAKERREYVLGRMKDDGYITKDQYDKAMAEPITTIAFESPATRAAFYFLDEIQRDAKRKAGIHSLTSGSYTIKSTIHPALQRISDDALDDGLAAWELSAHRALWTGPVGSLTEDLAKYHSTWTAMLPRVHSKFYDIHWPLAMVTSIGQAQSLKNKKGKIISVIRGFKVGLKDGREMQLMGSKNVLATLKVNDLIHVKIDEDKKTATLQIPPRVQGAVLVLEAKTGRVLAMSGGFSYSASQLNRVTQTARQPGSTLKPFIHLSALQLGYQPNTLIPDIAVNLPPIEKGGHWWSPKNYDGGSGGLVSMRQTVEQSLNLPTARIMASMADTPTQGLDYIRGITHELGIYKQPLRVYPFVLGAQPARLLDMAVAYATVANIANTPNSVCPMCMKPVPHFFDSIDQDGRRVYTRPRYDLQPVNSLDRVSLYQIRRITEGTVARGTAVAMKDLAGSVAGKTGTSNNENDAWFICYTNDLVIATWVGYDSRKIMPSLGAGNTGAHVALPIGERILRKSFEVYAPQEALAGAPADIQRQIVEYPIPGFGYEVYRLGQDGPLETRNSILRGNEVGMALVDPPGEDQKPSAGGDSDDEQLPDQDRPQDPDYRPLTPGNEDSADQWLKRDRQVDPNYFQPQFSDQEQ